MQKKYISVPIILALAACSSDGMHKADSGMSTSVDKMEVVKHETPKHKCVLPSLAHMTSERDDFREKVAQQRAIEKKSSEIASWNESIAEEETGLISSAVDDTSMATEQPEATAVASFAANINGAAQAIEAVDLSTIAYAEKPQDILVLNTGTTGNAMPPKEFDLSPRDIRKAYKCAIQPNYAAYQKSSHSLIREFTSWNPVTKQAIFSSEMGNRYVLVYANDRAVSSIPNDKDIDRDIPIGGVIGMTTMAVSQDGVVDAGPVFVIEKMPKYFNSTEGNYRYIVAGTDGKVNAVTRGLKSESAQLCADCSVLDADLLYLKLLNAGQLPDLWQERAAAQEEQRALEADEFNVEQEDILLDPDASGDGDLLEPAPSLELDPNV